MPLVPETPEHGTPTFTGTPVRSSALTKARPDIDGGVHL